MRTCKLACTYMHIENEGRGGRIGRRLSRRQGLLLLETLWSQVIYLTRQKS